jgi:hypothetical protein
VERVPPVNLTRFTCSVSAFGFDFLGIFPVPFFLCSPADLLPTTPALPLPSFDERS